MLFTWPGIEWSLLSLFYLSGYFLVGRGESESLLFPESGRWDACTQCGNPGLRSHSHCRPERMHPGHRHLLPRLKVNYLFIFRFSVLYLIIIFLVVQRIRRPVIQVREATRSCFIAICWIEMELGWLTLTSVAVLLAAQRWTCSLIALSTSSAIESTVFVLFSIDLATIRLVIR